MKKILVIDDSRVTQRMVQFILKREGYDVETAGDGQIGIDLMTAADDPFALVICDINMPHVDGFEFLQWLRADGTQCDTPVLMLTAMGDEASHDRAQSLGANDVITQPFDSTTLVKAVQDHLV